MRIDLAFFLCFLNVAVWNTFVCAQEPTTGRTILEVEILMPRIGGDPLMAQRWGDAFQKLGEGVRIRQALASDKPEVSEKMQGRYRIVKIVGDLERSGALRFPKKEFTLDTVDQLKEWLSELKAYGAQGAPDGKPNWGMSKAQFDEVVKSLSGPVEKPVKGLTLTAAIEQLSLPENFPIVFHSSSDTLVKDLKDVPLLIEVQGLSTGTSLAAILSQYGLAFIPLRKPGGGVDLFVKPMPELKNAWSIGWPSDPATPRNQIMPSMFKMANSGFDNLPLVTVLQAVSAQTEIPILINQAACLAMKIDPSTVQVSYPFKKTAPALVLKTAVRSSKLNYEFRLDDAGKPFVYVYPFVPFKAPE